MSNTPKALLAFETLLFGTALLVHAGVIASGFEHARAATAEGVIAAVLAVGFISCLALQARAWTIAFAVQAFALLGTLVGAFTIAIGIGPQTRADYAFHGALLVVLVSGLVFSRRSRPARGGATYTPAQ